MNKLKRLFFSFLLVVFFSSLYCSDVGQLSSLLQRLQAQLQTLDDQLKSIKLPVAEKEPKAIVRTYIIFKPWFMTQKTSAQDPEHDNPYNYVKTLIEQSGVASDGFSRRVEFKPQEIGYTEPHITLINFDIPLYEDQKPEQVAVETQKNINKFLKSLKSRVTEDNRIFVFNKLDFTKDKRWLIARFTPSVAIKKLRSDLENHIQTNYTSAKVSHPEWEPHMTLGQYDPAASDGLARMLKQPTIKTYRFFINSGAPFRVSSSSLAGEQLEKAKQKFME